MHRSLTEADTWYNSWDKFWSDTKNFFSGASQALLDEGKDFVDLAKILPCYDFGICTKEQQQAKEWAQNHPGEVANQLWHSLIDPCSKVADNPDDTAQQGKCTISIVSIFLPVKGLGKIGKLGKLGKLGGSGDQRDRADLVDVSPSRCPQDGNAASNVDAWAETGRGWWRPIWTGRSSGPTARFRRGPSRRWPRWNVPVGISCW